MSEESELKKRIREIFEKYPICPSTTLEGKSQIIRYVGNLFIEAVNELVVDEAKKDIPTFNEYCELHKDSHPYDLFARYASEVSSGIKKWFGDKK